MKKWVVSTFASSVFLALGAASQAMVFTYELIPGATQYTTFPGVFPTTTNDPTITNFFAPSATVGNPQSYSVPSVLKFGDDTTTPGMGNPNTTATFNHVPVSFEFKLDSGMMIGATAHTFSVTGNINGSVGYDGTTTPFSRASVTYTSIVDDTGGETSVVSMDPQNHLPALLMTTVINGSPVDVYLDISQSKPIPGDVITHVGYIASGVPEPGAIALAVGMGISGGGILLRRRRRA